jgi:hypothetical protein
MGIGEMSLPMLSDVQTDSIPLKICLYCSSTCNIHIALNFTNILEMTELSLYKFL